MPCTCSMVAGVGLDESYGEVGLTTSVTQKHFAILSSPLINVTHKPRSFLFFRAPRRTQLLEDAIPLVSVGDESI